MSSVYNMSASEKYSKYFEKNDKFSSKYNYFIKAGEIKNTGLKTQVWETGEAGIPIAWDADSQTVAIDHTDSHTLIIGPTGSKKSRLIVMPTVRILGAGHESVIISDPKAEIYNRTSGYLESIGYRIAVINLRSPLYGQRWNPLFIPYNFFESGEIDKAYEFVNDISENLFRAIPSNKDPFWDNSAGSLFFGLTLLLFKYCKDFGQSATNIHIGNVIKLRNDLLSDSNGNINRRLWEYAKKDPIIRSALIGTVETAKDTRGGILSTFDQAVQMFSMQQNLMDMLSYNDIDFDSIGKKPTAIYLIVPDEKTGYHGLVSLFIKQSYEYMIFRAQENNRDAFNVGRLPLRVNYLLDEFSSLPTISDFPAMITAARSRNIRFILVIQSKHQLIQRYKEEAETIQTNCNNLVFLTSRELQFLEEISALCGKTVDDNPKPVLSVSALQRLDKERGEALIISDRLKPRITCLPDIDIYDSGYYEKRNATSRKMSSLPEIEFKIPLTDEENRVREELMNKLREKGVV